MDVLSNTTYLCSRSTAIYGTAYYQTTTTKTPPTCLILRYLLACIMSIFAVYQDRGIAGIPVLKHIDSNIATKVLQVVHQGQSI